VVYFLSIVILALSFYMIWLYKNATSVIGEVSTPMFIFFITLIVLILLCLATIYINTNAIKSLYMIIAIFFLIACGILVI